MSTMNPAADLEKPKRSTSILDLGDALDSKDLATITVALRKATQRMELALRRLAEDDDAPVNEDDTLLEDLARGIALLVREVSRLQGDLCKV